MQALLTKKNSENFSGLASISDGSDLSDEQTKTEAFQRWFKDSKAVDENGEPLGIIVTV